MLSQAQQLIAAGQHATAGAMLTKLLADEQTRPEAHYLLSISAQMRKQTEAALDHAQKAVQLRSDDARYQFTLGRAHKAADDIDAAEAAYRAALALQPGYLEAKVSLGIVLKARGDAEAAIALYDEVLARDPKFAPALANRANAVLLRSYLEAEAGSDDTPSDEVIAAQQLAAELNPRDAVLARNVGVLLMRARRRLESAEAFNRALTLDPTDVDACLHMGHVLRTMGSATLACELYEKWLDRNAPHAAVMRSLAAILTRDGHIDRALPWAQKAADMDLDPHALIQVGSTLMQARRMVEAMDYCRRAIDLSNRKANTYSTALLGSNYLHEDPHDVLGIHAEFGQQLAPPDQPEPPWQPVAAGERLRVGFVSGDFVRHSVSYFIGPVLEHIDKRRFEVTCYHNLAFGDEVTARMKTYADHWVECEGLSDAHLRQRVIDDGIHLLIDLAGLTSNSRSTMFARRCAPVQLNYLGYPTLTGVPAIDFRITDAVIDPGDMPAHPSEQPLCLSRSMFCYRPDENPTIEAPPVLKAGHITFGSFNNIAKVTDHTLELWARIMAGVPGSRLLLKSQSMAQEANRRNIEQFMAERGVAAERLTLQPWAARKASHLLMYNDVDIALDPFPYNGATTTCEALWMGVPVVTLRGRTHTSRMGASILNAIGRPDWVADTDDGYVDTITRLAGDVDALAKWREQARTAIAASALFDEAGFTREFESLLERAWAQVGERCVTALSHELA
jgi:predicted O-linked N-acetylglucosamine transferase (SPINDLY family)